MKTNEPLKMQADESAFLTTLVILVLLVFPSLPLGKYSGGLAMALVSVFGMITYCILFYERLRSRGQLKKAAITFGVSAALAAAVAYVLPFIHR